MERFFTILMILAMFAVLSSLGVGLFAMARGGSFNQKHANRLMRARVVLQGLALLLFVLAALARNT